MVTTSCLTPIFSNALNAGLLLRSYKNKIVFEQVYFPICYQNLRQPQIINFIQIFSVRNYLQYQIIASDSPRNHSFHFSYGTITSQNRLLQTQPTNFASSWHSTITLNTLIYQDKFYLNPCSNRCLHLSQSGRVKNVFLA